MFVSSNGHTGRQRRLGKDVGERTDQEVESDLFAGQGSSSNVLVRVVVEPHLKTPTAVHPYDEHA